MTGQPDCPPGWESAAAAGTCVPSTAGTSTIAGQAAGAGT
jgi:hypothetical protein